MSSQQNGLVAGNKQNEAGGTTPHSRSRFQLSDSFFTTERFADYNPCFVMEGVSGDHITLNQPHQVRTYSLKAPLMQNILKKKDYFMVPLQAILPLNYEKFYTKPVIGDDVPLGVGTGLPNFWGRLLAIFNADLPVLRTTLTGNGPAATKIHDLLAFLLYYEMFYSNGSLMKQLRISGNAYVSLYNSDFGQVDFDWLFDQCISKLCSNTSITTSVTFNLIIGSKTYVVVLSGPGLNSIGSEVGGFPYIGIRECLELLRDDLYFSVSAWSAPSGWDPFNDLASGSGALNVTSSKAGYVPSASGSNPDYHTDGIPLNLARLWSYGLVCAHYYSNDHVDVLYSAELFRQYIRSLYMNYASNATLTNQFNSFVYNGMSYEYDALSAFSANIMFAGNTGYTRAFQSCFSILGAPYRAAYMTALFGFKKSLRFMDYFTGSRTYPLANGTDVPVDVSGSTVGVLDISKQIQATRFYQAVNRSGRKFSAYMKELFGITPKPDYHNPFYLAHTSDVVGSSETENTGADQLSKANSITSILRSNAARYAFTFEPDRDCVVIGISYYDLPRVYTRATERQNFYIDREDMFNPFMQYIGDQSIYRAELGTTSPSLLPFSYTNRDMEYKQRYNFGAGGFCSKGTNLDLWFFPADKLRRWFGSNIGSSFIRSFNSEFDQFYVSLTGWSLGTYFHFIVRYDNRCDASRPMAYAPGIMQ